MTSSLLLLPDPLSPRVIVPVRVASMGQIEPVLDFFYQLAGGRYSGRLQQIAF